MAMAAFRALCLSCSRQHRVCVCVCNLDICHILNEIVTVYVRCLFRFLALPPPIYFVRSLSLSHFVSLALPLPFFHSCSRPLLQLSLSLGTSFCPSLSLSRSFCISLAVDTLVFQCFPTFFLSLPSFLFVSCMLSLFLLISLPLSLYLFISLTRSVFISVPCYLLDSLSLSLTLSFSLSLCLSPFMPERHRAKKESLNKKNLSRWSVQKICQCPRQLLGEVRRGAATCNDPCRIGRVLDSNFMHPRVSLGRSIEANLHGSSHVPAPHRTSPSSL